MRLLRILVVFVVAAAALVVTAIPGAATVTVRERPNNIVDINGDNTDEFITICGGDSGHVVLNSELEIVAVIPATTRTLRINMRGGDDTVQIGSTETCGSNRLSFALDVRVILGSGDDVFSAANLTVGRNLIVLGQGGADELVLSDVAAGRLNANTSSGSSEVTIRDSDLGRTSLRGGSSVDVVSIERSFLGRNPVIFTNSGDDSVTAIGSAALGRVTINAGGGDDLVDWSEVSTCEDDVCPDETPRQSDYKLNVIMGGGTDTTRTAVDLVPGDRLSGGAGNADRLLFFAPGGATINAYEFFGPALENQAPIANTDLADAEPGQTVIIDVLFNDFDPDGDDIAVVAINGQSVSSPGDSVGTNNGTATLRSDGGLDFRPDSEYSGVETFFYTISDVNGATATAAVMVTVTAPNIPPIANNDFEGALAGTSFNLDVFFNDEDPDTIPPQLMITEIDGASVSVGDERAIDGDSTVELLGGGELLITVGAETAGLISFTYAIVDNDGGTDDATVFIEVDQPNVPPTAGDDVAETDFETVVDIDVAINDEDPDSANAPTIIEVNGQAATPGDNTVVSTTNGSATVLSTGEIRYTPNGEFSGEDMFTYTIQDDDGDTATATVTVTVGEPPNGLPMANDDEYDVGVGTTMDLDVLFNDSDPDLDDLTIIEINGTPIAPNGSISTSVGSVMLNGDATLLIYTADLEGDRDLFNYTISDGNGGTATAAVTVFLQFIEP
ncbi:MAG: Ig-like domain-containing protein [Acidimicrobiales bacterium]